jgi:hypothetical protein
VERDEKVDGSKKICVVWFSFHDVGEFWGDVEGRNRISL